MFLYVLVGISYEMNNTIIWFVCASSISAHSYMAMAIYILYHAHDIKFHSCIAKGTQHYRLELDLYEFHRYL